MFVACQEENHGKTCERKHTGSQKWIWCLDSGWTQMCPQKSVFPAAPENFVRCGVNVVSTGSWVRWLRCPSHQNWGCPGTCAWQPLSSPSSPSPFEDRKKIAGPQCTKYHGLLFSYWPVGVVLCRSCSVEFCRHDERHNIYSRSRFLRNASFPVF